MTQRVKEDHKDFVDAISGKLRRRLTKLIDTGRIFRIVGKNKKKISVSLPTILDPKFVFGDPPNGRGSGIGKGKGKKGDVIHRRDPKGGDQAGEESSEGITIELDLEEVIKFLQSELKLPNLKPKETDTYDEVKYKYNSLSIVGPNSLRHVQATMKQAIKRLASIGELDKLHELPGLSYPIPLIIPDKRDFRYRQYNEIKIPSSNAVIFFLRDCSASMDNDKCEIVSDVCWWLDCWIRRFYDRTESVYVVHDTLAQEVDEQKFYKYRYGGGTKCSSALELVVNQFENRFPPNKWNIYVFYFGDGENWPDDNPVFCNMLVEHFNKDIVNLFGLVQVQAYDEESSLKEAVDRVIKSGKLDKDYAKTADIKRGDNVEIAMKKAILRLLGKETA